MDNAKNNDTFVRSLEKIMRTEGITFEAKKRHIR